MSQFVSIWAEPQPVGTVQFIATSSYPLGFALYCEALKRGLEAETEDVCSLDGIPSIRVWFVGSAQDAQGIVGAAQCAPFVLAARKHITLLRNSTEPGGCR